MDDESIEEQTAKEVDMESLRKELRKTLLQIHNMDVLLPKLPDSCTPSFKRLIYVTDSVERPPGFLENTQHLIIDAQILNFNDVDTKVHTVKSSIQYKANKDASVMPLLFSVVYPLFH